MNVTRHLYDDEADDGKDEAKAVDDKEGISEFWPGEDGGADSLHHLKHLKIHKMCSELWKRSTC